MKKLLSMMLLVLLTSCASTPSNDELAMEAQKRVDAEREEIQAKIRARERATTKHNQREVKRYNKEYQEWLRKQESKNVQ